MTSKLLYGLETAQLPNTGLNKIDAFQVKGPRRILGFAYNNWDRPATNQIAIEETTEEAYIYITGS